MLTKKLILAPQYSKYIYYTSWLMLFTSLYGFYESYYSIGSLTFLVFCTSINYWRNPIDDMRRVVDLTAVISTLLYTIYYVQWCNNLYIYYLILGIIITFYFLSKYYRYQNNFAYCTAYHCGVHIMGHVCNLFIFNKIIDCSCYLT